MNDEKDLYKPRTFRPNKNEKEDILKFISIQENFNDTIRFLIEKEIYENGIRNLQEHIPSKRSLKYFSNFYKSKSYENKNIENKSIETEFKKEMKFDNDNSYRDYEYTETNNVSEYNNRVEEEEKIEDTIENTDDIGDMIPECFED